jgi:hypothetical protein
LSRTMLGGSSSLFSRVKMPVATLRILESVTGISS